MNDNEKKSLENLKDVKVVFDVGARTDIHYFDIFPKATFHLFEPYLPFFEELKLKVGDRKKVYLNNYALGDSEREELYNHTLQALTGGDATKTGDTPTPIKTLDWYIKENNVTQIDFLKIDAEGYDYKILLGGPETIKISKVIQYEHWDEVNKGIMHQFMEGCGFELEYLGDRNVLCKRKTN